MEVYYGVFSFGVFVVTLYQPWYVSGGRLQLDIVSSVLKNLMEHFLLFE